MSRVYKGLKIFGDGNFVKKITYAISSRRIKCILNSRTVLASLNIILDSIKLNRHAHYGRR